MPPVMITNAAPTLRIRAFRRPRFSKLDAQKPVAGKRGVSADRNSNPKMPQTSPLRRKPAAPSIAVAAVSFRSHAPILSPLPTSSVRAAHRLLRPSPPRLEAPAIRPSCITRARSESPMISSISLDANRIATPRPASSSMSLYISSSAPTSMPRVGSSSKRSFG